MIASGCQTSAPFGIGEARRRDADDRDRPSVQTDSPSRYAGIAAELTAPQAVPDYRDFLGPARCIRRDEAAGRRPGGAASTSKKLPDTAVPVTVSARSPTSAGQGHAPSYCTPPTALERPVPSPQAVVSAGVKGTAVDPAGSRFVIAAPAASRP